MDKDEIIHHSPNEAKVLFPKAFDLLEETLPFEEIHFFSVPNRDQLIASRVPVQKGADVPYYEHAVYAIFRLRTQNNLEWRSTRAKLTKGTLAGIARWLRANGYTSSDMPE